MFDSPLSCTFFFIAGFATFYLSYFAFLRKRLNNGIGSLLAQLGLGSKGTRFGILFLNALILGCFIEFLVHEVKDTCHFSPLIRIETAATDWVMKMLVRSEPAPPIKEHLIPIRWIDIDEKTYEQLGEPLSIQRGTLWKLISEAIAAQAAVIVVDFALDRPVEIEGDTLLTQCLENYSALATRSVAPNKISCFHSTDLKSFPKILLAKSLKANQVPMAERPSQLCASRACSLKDDPRGLESIVRTSSVLFWASTTFVRDADHIARQWRLFEPTKRVRLDDWESNVLPSVPLLTWAILRTPSLDGKPFNVNKFLDELRTHFDIKNAIPSPETCSHGDRSDTWDLKGSGLEQTIHLNLCPKHLEQRVPYLVGNLEEPWPSPLVPWGGKSEFLFDRIYARELLPNNNQYNFVESHRDSLKGKIVIIGASYEESRDFHGTPIGRIPGALWMANAIAGIMEFGQLKHPSLIQESVVIIVGLVVVAAWFAGFPSILATVIAGLSVAVILIPVSLYLFSFGTWLDFSLPILGVAGHHFIEQIMELTEGHGHHPGK